MNTDVVFDAEGIDVFYGTSQILFGVGLSVRQGETMALLGRNGAGKSTTMKAIMGLAPPRRGRVSLSGTVISGQKPHTIARAGLGFVPEDRQVFPEHTVEDNLVIGRKKGPEERWRMIDKVRELWETQKITVVFIEHDMDIVFKIAPKIVVLCYGRILATGTPDEIRSNSAVIDAYLGAAA